MLAVRIRFAARRLPRAVTWRAFWLLLCVLVLALVHSSSRSVRADGPPKSSVPFARDQLRRPTAACLLEDRQRLAVANEATGTVTLVDLQAERPIAELPLARQLAWLAKLPRQDVLLAVDPQAQRLIAAHVSNQRLVTRASAAIGRSAVHVAVDDQGRWASVAGLWSRQLEVFSLDRNPDTAQDGSNAIELTRVHQIALPFAPRLQIFLPDSEQFIVADAFAGHLALVDARAGNIIGVVEIDGHNIRGLTWDSTSHNETAQLVVAHQTLAPVPTTISNIVEGQLMKNKLSWFDVAALRHATGAPLQAQHSYELDQPGAGAADPAGVTSLADGRFAVALAGVQQLSLFNPADAMATRIDVGRRPLAVVASDKSLAVINTLGDSISLVDLTNERVTATIQLTHATATRHAPRTEGEKLFFDARLSVDGRLSCHSCHTDGHTNGQLADTLGDNSYGTPKRTLTLRGTALTYRWAWNGQFSNLHDQVQKSVVDTMHGRPLDQQQLLDLVSYLHTLKAPPPPRPASEDVVDREQLDEGRAIFAEVGCADCHIPPLVYSTHEAYDVGLRDERGLTHFNPPSLRGVGQLYHLLHDNRASSLEQVIRDVNHPYPLHLDDKQLSSLIRFLESL